MTLIAELLNWALSTPSRMVLQPFNRDSGAMKGRRT